MASNQSNQQNLDTYMNTSQSEVDDFARIVEGNANDEERCMAIKRLEISLGINHDTPKETILKEFRKKKTKKIKFPPEVVFFVNQVFAEDAQVNLSYEGQGWYKVYKILLRCWLNYFGEEAVKLKTYTEKLRNGKTLSIEYAVWHECLRDIQKHIKQITAET